MGNTWSNKIVAFHPLIENDKCLGFAVVSKDLKYFYPANIDFCKLLKEVKEVIVFNGFKLKEIWDNFPYTKHNLQSLYYQLNSEIKFQSIEDIVKQECYSIDVNSIQYVIRPEGARFCVVAASFILEYYLKHYKEINKNILKIDNKLLELFSTRKAIILTNQVAIRTILSLLLKNKWDLERKVFKEVGYPVWNTYSTDNPLIVKSLDKIREYKDQISCIEKYLGVFKIQINFDTTATATGRIICRDKINHIGLFAPNNKHRDLFYCKENKIFISADYKRQEAYILATVSKDKQLYEDIQNEDFYSRLARWVLRDTSKQIGKTLFYAVIYGSSPKSLSEEFNISELKAQEAINKVKNRYKNLNKWLINFKEKTNYFGRPLHKHTINAYIQSTAADIIRQKLISTYKFNPVLVLADNIIYRVPKENYLNTIDQIKNELNKTPFQGLYIEPVVSNTLKF